LLHAITITDCDAVYLLDSGASGATSNNVLMTANSYGLHNHFIRGLTVDATSGTGPNFYITGSGTATDIAIYDSWFSPSSTASAGLRIDATTLGRFNVVGNEFINATASGAYGLYLSNSGNVPVNVEANMFTSNTNGIYVNAGSGCQAPLIDGNYDTGSTTYSLVTSSTTNMIRVGANYFQSGHSYGATPAKDLGW
jgi:hypothetical protein